MVKPVLVIIAGGMGSRYGGMKQIDPVDEQGQWIIDYSLYDAARAGFETAVCVVAPGMEPDFRDTIGARARGKIDLRFAVQHKDTLPPGYTWPEGRVKPWGTGHAVLSAAPAADGPFAVVNADDFYGADAFTQAYQFLSARAGERRHAMVGYRLDHTLTDFGTVSRGICETKDGRLVSVTERLKITQCPGGAQYEEDDGRTVFLPGGTLVSMNLWAFGPGFMETGWAYFADFLREHYHQNPMRCEFHLPHIPNRLLKEGKAEITVLRAGGQWLGVTYQADMPAVRHAIRQLKERKVYPADLWA